jgi:hypothetical protein
VGRFSRWPAAINCAAGALYLAVIFVLMLSLATLWHIVLFWLRPGLWAGVSFFPWNLANCSAFNAL